MNELNIQLRVTKWVKLEIKKYGFLFVLAFSKSMICDESGYNSIHK